MSSFNFTIFVSNFCIHGTSLLTSAVKHARISSQNLGSGIFAEGRALYRAIVAILLDTDTLMTTLNLGFAVLAAGRTVGL